MDGSIVFSRESLLEMRRQISNKTITAACFTTIERKPKEPGLHLNSRGKKSNKIYKKKKKKKRENEGEKKGDVLQSNIMNDE